MRPSQFPRQAAPPPRPKPLGADGPKVFAARVKGETGPTPFDRGGCPPDRLWEAKEFRADKGGVPLVTQPSDLFNRQIYATFQEDHVAMALIPCFGEGHLLWASDYPHPDSVWPNSQRATKRQMQHLSPETRRTLTHDNAAVLLGLGSAR